jgi:RHS repeat-associated protein
MNLTSYYLSSNTNKTYTASGQIDYYPFGMERSVDTQLPSGPFNSGTNPYLYNGKEIDRMNGLNENDYGGRWYDAAVGRWGSVDPLAEMDYSISPYAYCKGNSVNSIDPTGMVGEPLAWTSTHTDETGNVIAVYNDGDLGVYKHDGVGAAAKADVDRNHSSTNTSAGGEWMGETAYWDEFVDRKHNGELIRNPDGSYKPYDNYDISFDDDDTWDDDISRYFSMSGLFNILDLALESSPNGFFDLKSHTSNIGKKLNGKYATAESAGNYLAGLNAASRVGFDLYMRLAGSVHVNGNSKLALINSFIGKEYGTYPWYGEINYCTRRVMEGWLANPKANDRSAVLQRYRLNNINR